MATKLSESKVMTAAELKQFHEFEAAGEGVQGLGGGIIRRVIRFAVSIVAARAKRNDPDFDEAAFQAEVDGAVEALGDGTIWEWLLNGGFAKILEWVMTILALFGSRKVK